VQTASSVDRLGVLCGRTTGVVGWPTIVVTLATY